MRRCLARLGAAALLGALTGCGDAASERPPGAAAASSIVVNERTGSVAGIRIGDSTRRVRAVLGRPQERSRVPASELGLPWIVEPPPAGRARALAYDGMSVLTSSRAGVYNVSVWRRGTATRTGVRLGDSLADARARHRGLDCGVRNENTEYVPYPYCRGRVGRHWVWFGQDPIKSVTVSSTPIG